MGLGIGSCPFQGWIQEDKASVLSKIVSNPRSSVPEIGEALRRYHYVVTAEGELSKSTLNSLRVTLTQRLLTEQLDFVRVAKDVVQTADFVRLIDRMVLPADSHGKLGGKSAGNGPHPRIRIGSSTTVTPVAKNRTRMAVPASPAPRSMALMAKTRMSVKIPANEIRR